MTKQTVNATLVKLADSGVGVARIVKRTGLNSSFVYFKPRDLSDYKGETWSELALRGLTPGSKLTMNVDMDDSGQVHGVADVRIAS